mgnify:CR=1 FL=1
MGGLVKVDLGHGRGWAAPTAAASIRRIDRDLGRPADINEAGRSPEKADDNYRKWLAYKNGTGPWAPYALPASRSVHCWGNAADSDDWYNAAAAAVWRDHGWRQTARYNDDRDEPWHGEHFPNLDNHRNEPAPAGMEDDMFSDNDRKLLQRIDAANRNGKKGSHSDGTNTARLKRVEAKLAAQDAAIEKLATMSGADPKAILKAVQDGVAKAMSGLEVTLTVD